MITINDEFPGPVIRVTEGSVVKVRVKTESYGIAVRSGLRTVADHLIPGPLG